MTKQEFLSASLPYGLKHQLTEKGIFNLDEEYPRSHNNCMTIIGTSGNEYDLSDDNWGVGYIEIDEFKPIIRHIDTLTQECVQADYNNGKPFIPIVELAWTDKAFVHQWNKANTEAALARLSLEDAMLLLRWHFWPNMPEGEDVVYVTEEFNPYK